MRVIFLAAAAFCATAFAADAQPSKVSKGDLISRVAGAEPLKPRPAAVPGQGLISAVTPSPAVEIKPVVVLLGFPGVVHYADSPWLAQALRDIGTNPTGWKRQWCARSLNLWLQQSGKRGCADDRAISCLQAGERLDGPKVGALAVLPHHVGIVKDVQGEEVILVSGNHDGRPGARTVGISKLAASVPLGYIWPK